MRTHMLSLGSNLLENNKGRTKTDDLRLGAFWQVEAVAVPRSELVKVWTEFAKCCHSAPRPSYGVPYRCKMASKT